MVNIKSLVICKFCGRFNIDNFYKKPELTTDKKIILKHYFSILSPTDKRRLIIIDNNNLNETIESVNYPKNLAEKANKLLEYLIANTQYYKKPVELSIKQACRLFFCIDEKELNDIISYWAKKGFLSSPGGISKPIFSYNITLDSIEYYQQRIAPKIKSKQGFVAMWFNDKENKKTFRPNMQKVYAEVIKPAIEENEYKPIKIDCVDHCNNINDEMIAQIRKSRFMIADLTGYRGGVYFEAGFAYGLGIPVIYTCHKEWLSTNKKLKIEGVHFDLNHRNMILWSEDDLYEGPT